LLCCFVLSEGKCDANLEEKFKWNRTWRKHLFTHGIKKFFLYFSLPFHSSSPSLVSHYGLRFLNEKIFTSAFHQFVSHSLSPLLAWKWNWNSSRACARDCFCHENVLFHS
jgi:hypothetical protein